mgnify:CR=1 FL=1
MENKNRPVLCHYVSVEGKSLSRAKEILARYNSIIKEKSKELNSIDYIVPIKEGQSRIEFLINTGEIKTVKIDESVIEETPSNQYRSRSEVIINYFLAKRAIEILNKGIPSIKNDDIELDMKKLSEVIIDIHEETYIKIFKEKPPIGYTFNESGTFMCYWIDINTLTSYCKAYQRSKYYEYLLEIEKIKERNE